MAKQTPTQKPEEITPAAKEIPAQTPLPTETTLEPDPDQYPNSSPEIANSRIQQKHREAMAQTMGITPEKQKEINAFRLIQKTRRFIEWLDPENKTGYAEVFDKATPAKKAEVRRNLEKQYGKSIKDLVPDNYTAPPSKAEDRMIRTPVSDLAKELFPPTMPTYKKDTQDKKGREMLLKAKGQREA